MHWIILVYTVPTEPSRKRASIWRELKKLGAVYLRDGVCVLPKREDTQAALQTVGAKVVEFAGRAVSVESAQLPTSIAEAVIAESRDGRAAEYREVLREAESLLKHVRREIEHREFTFQELEELEADLGKLRRWAEQVNARDYFGCEEKKLVKDALERCEAALTGFLEYAFSQEQQEP